MGKKSKKKKEDEAVMYGGLTEWTSEDQQDYSLSAIEDLREEGAKRARLLLDLPGPRANINDVEVDIVLMYLAFCSDYYLSDKKLSQNGEYNHETALFDLSLLAQAVDRVEASVKRAMAAQKKVKKVELTAGPDGGPMTENEFALWEAEMTVELMNLASSEPNETPAKCVESFVVGARKEAS